MRSGALFELCLFVAAAGCFALSGSGSERVRGALAPGPRPAGCVRVVTWNVGGARNGGVPLESSDLEHVAQSLLESDADLLLLQEFEGAWQVQSLLEHLGSEWSARWSEPDESACLAVLARGGRLRQRQLGLERGRFVATRYRPDSGREMLVVGLHADARNSARRNELVGSVLDAALERAGGRPVLVAGDFNLDLDLGKRRDLFSDDAYLDVETYNYVAQRLEDAGLDEGATAEPDRRLDYVFVDSEGFEVVRALVWKRRRVGSMDHDPVLVDLRLRPN